MSSMIFSVLLAPLVTLSFFALIVAVPIYIWKTAKGENVEIKRLVGGIMMATGILVACAGGLCTLILFTSSLQSASHVSADVKGFMVIGLIPVSIGVGLFFAGRYLRQKGNS